MRWQPVHTHRYHSLCQNFDWGKKKINTRAFIERDSPSSLHLLMRSHRKHHKLRWRLQYGKPCPSVTSPAADRRLRVEAPTSVVEAVLLTTINPASGWNRNRSRRNRDRMTAVHHATGRRRSISVGRRWWVRLVARRRRHRKEVRHAHLLRGRR